MARIFADYVQQQIEIYKENQVSPELTRIIVLMVGDGREVVSLALRSLPPDIQLFVQSYHFETMEALETDAITWEKTEICESCTGNTHSVLLPAREKAFRALYKQPSPPPPLGR